MSVMQKIICSKEFQRLKGVRQLGTYYVWDSKACHTRYDHSIGVMGCAEMVSEFLGLDQREKQILMVAGLVHDIGHGPLSHLYDKITKSHHEHRSVDILEKLYNTTSISSDITKKDLEIIKLCILGKQTTPAYLSQLISSDVDIDRIDYLCRDSMHLGVDCPFTRYCVLNSMSIDDEGNLQVEDNIKTIFLKFRDEMYEKYYHSQHSEMINGLIEQKILSKNIKLQFDMTDDELLALL